MAEYQIEWAIDLPANTPREAAELARRLQTHPDTTALVFNVFDKSTGEWTVVDLQHDDNPVSR